MQPRNSTARITALTNAITAFSALLNAPRGQIANRAALIRDVETNVAELLTKVEALDDLVLQFDATPAGRNFIARLETGAHDHRWRTRTGGR